MKFPFFRKKEGGSSYPIPESVLGDDGGSIDWDGKCYELPARTLVHCSTAEARKRLPLVSARKLCVLPLGMLKTPLGQGVVVAAKDSSWDLVKAIKWETGCEVKIVKVGEQELQKAIFEAYTREGGELQERITGLK